MTRVELHRVAPDRNMQRFYSLATRPNLLGQTELVRTWGRTGQ